MVKAVIKNAKIRGISVVVPPKELSLLDDKELYGGNEQRIKRVIESSGFLKRRVSEPHVMTSDLCFEAAEDLISKLGIEKTSIDALLFISYTPDYLMPATSYVLHQRLGLSESCVVMDIPQACSGYVLGLYQAGMLLNNGCKRVLLLVGDSFSKFTDMFINHSAPVFGDAGSATLIDYDEQAPATYFNIQSDGTGYDALICSAGGFKTPPKKEDFYENGQFRYQAKMDGGRIFDFAINRIYPSIQENLDFAGLTSDQVDYYVLHQANKLILNTIASKLNINKDKMPTETLSKYGNQCGASIPATVADNLADEISKNSLRLAIAGFGVGLSWASAIINTGPIYCSTIKNYKGN